MFSYSDNERKLKDHGLSGFTLKRTTFLEIEKVSVKRETELMCERKWCTGDLCELAAGRGEDLFF